MEERQFYYAGFWRRFAAYLIDELLIGSVTFFLLLPIYFIFGLGVFAFGNMDEYHDYSAVSLAQYYNDDVTPAVVLGIIFIVLIVVGTSLIIQWLYFALMESSSRQATLGKMALGLKVTDMRGNRITFARATGRYFGKIISGLILNIGYIMAAFTERKQALHDMMANCLVIVDPPPFNKYTQGGNYEKPQSDTSS